MPGSNLVLATTSAKKRLELTDLLKGYDFELLTLEDFPGADDVEEDGLTFHENARIKGLAYARHTGRTVLAEDSGLIVDALGGAPGIHSARYAGAPRSDQRNNDRLLEELRTIPEERRTARYCCSAVLVAPDGELLGSAEGFCEGRILREPRGAGGFGYDPLFLIPDRGLTFGELPLEFKQTRSHRARAIAGLAPALERLSAR